MPARKSTQQPAGSTKLEPSEIFAAVGMRMTTKAMLDLCKDKSANDLMAWLTVDKNKPGPGELLSKGVEIEGNRTKYESFFKVPPDGGSPNKRTERFKDVVAGFSAAIGFKKFAAKFDAPQDFVAPAGGVFLTGARWPKEVDTFRLPRESDGFDYNSSDIVIRVKADTYYGISLKKKATAASPDPTLINKAFDTLLQGQMFEDARNELKEERQKYFPKIVKEAATIGTGTVGDPKPVIYIDGIDKLDPEKNPADRMKIWNTRLQGPSKTYALINLKGSNTDDQPVVFSEVEGGLASGPGKLFDKPSGGVVGLKDYINNKLAAQDNELFAEFDRVLQSYAQTFADGLIDTVLKTKMQSQLRAKNIGKYDFEFALVTGYGNYTKSQGPKLERAAVYEQHSILCGLANLAGNNQPYKLELDTQKKAAANAAKLFYNLSRDGTTILNIELRYKGDFRAQPQFFATMSKCFITQMFDSCVIEK